MKNGDVLRLLTLNTHSHAEENYEQKTEAFVERVCAWRPHVMALQEVNQTLSSPVVEKYPKGYLSCSEDMPLRQDNHALRVARMLLEEGLAYHFAWLPIKVGYGKFQEGLALFSLSPIKHLYTCCVSRTDDKANWKTRKILGMTITDHPHVRFYSVHYGWWGDADEPFLDQWQKTLSHLSGVNAILAGDFNNPAEMSLEGYDMVSASGFMDVYKRAEQCVGSWTVPIRDEMLHGWQNRPLPIKQGGMRIDQIWTSQPYPVKSYQVIFDGQNTPVVSDHFGILAEILMS